MAACTRKILSPLCLILGLLSSPAYVCGAAWSYDDVAHWKDHFPACNGTSQSPVNIADAQTDGDLKQFQLTNFNNVNGVSWTLANNGHSAQVTYSAGDLRWSGGGLPGEYKVAQFHFHWGNDSSVGSEHTFDNVAFPMEMHVVTYKVNYGSLDDALGHDDGLAVLGVFFQETSTANDNFAPLISKLSLVKQAGNSTTMTPIPLGDLLPDMSQQTYYRYKGSLTTPTCNEVVTWTLLPHSPLDISNAQLNEFRALLDAEGHNLVNNFRPVQPLNGRVITTSA